MANFGPLRSECRHSPNAANHFALGSKSEHVGADVRVDEKGNELGRARVIANYEYLLDTRLAEVFDPHDI